MVFENKISWNTIITGGMILIGGLFTFAEIRTQNALQDARIEANRLWMQESMEHERTARKEALIAETSARREAQAEFRIRMDTDLWGSDYICTIQGAKNWPKKPTKKKG